MEWGGGGMDSQYKLLSELLSDQAAFITSQKTSLANYWGGALPPCPPVSTGLRNKTKMKDNECGIRVNVAKCISKQIA